jgi:MFS family permease
MTVSASGCGVSLSLVAVYSLLKDRGMDVQSYSWMPLLGLSLFMLLGSVGIFTLNSVIISEVLTQKIRGIVFTALILESWIFGFITVKVSPYLLTHAFTIYLATSFQYFPYLMAMIGMHGCLFIFAAICLSGALFVLVVLPETKGKSIEAIVRELESK